MRVFELLVILFLGFLLYREFSRKTAVKIEGMNASEAGIEFDSTGIKFTKPTSFQNITVDNLTATNINLLPRGSIIMWFGENIPIGWTECNGSNGTPDLRGRFPLAAGQGQNLTPRIFSINSPTIGGAETHKLTIAEMPSHKHSAFYREPASERGNFYSGNYWAPGNRTSDTSFTGGDQAHNNMPPFFVLKFIMKL